MKLFGDSAIQAIGRFACVGSRRDRAHSGAENINIVAILHLDFWCSRCTFHSAETALLRIYKELVVLDTRGHRIAPLLFEALRQLAALERRLAGRRRISGRRGGLLLGLGEALLEIGLLELEARYVGLERLERLLERPLLLLHIDRS